MRRRRFPPSRRRRNVRKLPIVLMGGALVLGVLSSIFSFMDIGGEAILSAVQEGLRERTGMELTVAAVRGNPIRGYTFEEILLSTGKGERVLFAETLSGHLNFLSLLRGSPRLSLLFLGGIAADMDQFLTEIQRIEISGDGETSDIPIDRIGLRSSRFTSRWGAVDVDEVGAAIRGTHLELDATVAVNGVPVRGSADLDIRNGILVVNKAEGAFGKGRITAVGDIGSADSDTASALNLQGSFRGVNLQELTALWPSVLKKEDYSGTLDLDLEARGTVAAPILTGTASYEGTRLGGYPVERLGAHLRYTDQRLSVSGIQATVLSVPIDGELAIATRPGQPPSLMIQLEGRDAQLDEIGSVFPALAGMKGRVTAFTANIQGPANALSGAVHLSAPHILFQGKELSKLALQLKIAKSDTATVHGKFFFEGAQGYLQGTIASLLVAPRLALTAKLVELDVKRVADLIPNSEKYGLSGKVSAAVEIQGPLAAPALSGTLQSPSFAAQGHTLTNPSVTFAYAGDTLTLQKSSGTLNGIPIHLSGSIKALTSGAPDLDLKAQLALPPNTLKTYFPDIAAYDLKGDLRAGVRISGRPSSLKLSLVASSPALSAFRILSVKNFEVSTALGGDLTKLDRIDLALKAENVAVHGIEVSDLRAEIRKKGPEIALASLTARSGAGTLSGSGKARLASQGTAHPLDFALSFDQMELGPLTAASGVGLQGVLEGKLRIGGTTEAPELVFQGRSPALTVQGIPLSQLTVDLAGTPQALKIDRLKAEVGGTPLSASGMLRLASPVQADLTLRGTGLDLATLADGFPDLKGQVRGKADLLFDLSATDKGATGTGTLSAASVEAFGLKLTAITLPLALEGDRFRSSNGTFALYGGQASNTLNLSLKALKYSNTFTATDVDINPLIQDATGGLKGRITGRGRLSLNLSGTAGRTADYAGSGQFTLGPGGISGFRELDIATRLYGVGALRYARVSAPLEIRTGRLILKKGAIAQAPEGDPIYRYARLAEDGVIKFDKNLYLLAEGNVNFQLINALAGGALGGAGALIQGGARQLTTGAGIERLLKGALQGGNQGGAAADFRDVTVKISGKTDAPSVSLIKVGPSSRPRQEQETATPAASTDASAPAPSGKKIEERIVDHIVDAILPPKTDPSETREEGTPQDQRPAPLSPQEELKERIGNELKKGLEGIF